MAILQSLLAYPLFFLLVGMIVLFLRLEDRNAWLLALMFAGFIALASWLTPEAEMLVPAGIRRFALTYQFAFRGMLPALFYFFFAVFPVPSPLDRKVPWLKYALIGSAALVELPLACTFALTGSYATMLALAEVIGQRFELRALAPAYSFGAFTLGLASLAWNGWRAPTSDARRKIRVLALGMAAGLAPLLGMMIFVSMTGRDASPLSLPFWMWWTAVASLTLVPLSFAYAVVKHRVMEIPVLLKRSARYLLVRRGAAIFITIASMGAAWVFVKFFFQFFPRLRAPGPGAVVTVGMAGAGVGGLIAVGTARIQRAPATRPRLLPERVRRTPDPRGACGENPHRE
jgi:sigma-B regulation protein RsbU (phosphoserine phosphatase)